MFPYSNSLHDKAITGDKRNDKITSRSAYVIAGTDIENLKQRESSVQI